MSNFSRKTCLQGEETIAHSSNRARAIARRVLVAALAAGMLAGIPAIASAASTVVRPEAMNGWEFSLTASDPATTVGFVGGPATPPAGYGSVHQTIGAAGDHARVQTALLSGTALTDVRLEYATFVARYNNGQAPAANLSVDLTGDGVADDTLIFEPVYQSGAYGGASVPNQCPGIANCVALNAWQHWNATIGGWWVLGDGNAGPPLTTLAAYAAAHPGARVVGGPATLRLGVGSSGTPYVGFDGNLDAVMVGATTYDFETYTQTVDCDTATDDIGAMQRAIDTSPDGSTVRLRGTCDFSGAPAHGGDRTGVGATAVLVRPGTPIDGLTIESADAPQSAAIVGSGTQAAITVAPGNRNVTVRGLRFLNVARAIVAIDSENTTIGAGGTAPDAGANRIVGGATTDSAILGIASDRGVGAVSAGTISIRYGARQTVRNFTGLETATLTGFSVLGNAISYDPPGAPGAATDVVAIDVRQAYGARAQSIRIANNIAGMATSEFPSFAYNGIRVEGFHSRDPADPLAPASSDYDVRDVEITGNDLGRLQETGSNDVNAAGRAGIVIIGAADVRIDGNHVRARISPTPVATPGGGIIVSDSFAARITGNAVTVLADPSTQQADLGGIGIVDDLGVVVGQNALRQRTANIVARGNTIGGDAPGVSLQRGFVLNGAADMTVDNNVVTASSANAINIAATVRGAGSPGASAELPRGLTSSIVCRNTLDGTLDDPNEVAFGAAGSIANYFPGGGTYLNNAGCGAPAALRNTVPRNGGAATTANASLVTATFDRVLRAPPASSIVVRDKTQTPVAGSAALSGPVTAGGGQRTISFAPAEPLAEPGSPYTASVEASVEGAASSLVTFSFRIDNTPPARASIGSPATGSITNAQPVHALGTAEAGSTVRITDSSGALVGTATTSAQNAYDATLSYGIENGASHTLTATALDAAGNAGASSAAVTFTHDSQPPNPPVITTPAEESVTGLTSVTLGGTASDAGTIRIFEGSTLAGSGTSSGGSWTASVSGLAEGRHSFTAALRDQAGNQSASSGARTIVVDTSAPAVPTVTVSPLPINSANQSTLTVSGNAEQNARIEVSIDDNLPATATVQRAGVASTSGAYSVSGVDVSSLGDGSVSVRVRAIDAAGNGTSRTIAIAKDTTTPSPPGVYIEPRPVNAGNQASTRVHGYGEGAATAEIVVTTSGGVTTARMSTTLDQNGAYSVPFNATAFEDGTLTASVRLTDPAGNQGNPGTTTAPKDTVAPVAPFIDSPTDGQELGTTTVDVTGSAEPGAAIELTEASTVRGTATADGSGAWSTPVALSGDGRHTIGARQTDAAGNRGATQATRSFIVNTTAPALVSSTPADGRAVSSVTAVRAIYSEDLSAGVLEVRNASNTLVAGSVDVTGATLTFTPVGGRLSDAGSPYSARTSATDTGGTNSSTSTFSFSSDGVAPIPPAITNPTQGSVLRTSSVTVSGTAEANATVTLKDAGATIGTAVAGSSGAWTRTQNLADGSHSISATARDAAGNVSPPSAARAFSVDATAPATPIITVPADGALLNSRSVSISGTAEPGSTVAVRDQTADLGSVFATSSGTWSMSKTLAEGAHSVSARATDAAGNEGATSAARAFTVDATAPSAPIIATPAAGEIVRAASITMSGSAEPGALVTMKENGTTIGLATADSNGAWSVGRTFSDGAHTFNASARDAAGNTGSTAARSFSVDANAPGVPAITAPASGATITQSSVTIGGTAEASAHITVREGSTTIATTIATSSAAWSVAHTFPDGPHSITVSATDAAGNESAATPLRSFSVDGTTPSPPIITTPSQNQTFGASSVGISGTAEPAAIISIRNAGAEIATAAANGIGNWSLTRTFADGSYSITAVARDAAGHESAATSARAFRVQADRIAPPAPVFDRPARNSLNRELVNIGGFSEALSTVRIFAGGALIGSAGTNGGGTWSVTLEMTTGNYTITATATDASGNIGLASAQRSFIVDTTRPTITVTTQDGATLTPTGASTIEGTAGDNIGVQTVLVEYLNVDGQRALIHEANVFDPAMPSVTWSDHPPLPPGRYTVRATAIDMVGQATRAPQITVIKITPP